jgi:hypothetical protein
MHIFCVLCSHYVVCSFVILPQKIRVHNKNEGIAFAKIIDNYGFFGKNEGVTLLHKFT